MTNLADLQWFQDDATPTGLTGNPAGVTTPHLLSPLTTQPHSAAVVSNQAAATPGIDWALVKTLRVKASERLTQAIAQREDALDVAAQRELGRTIILDLVEEERREALSAGVTPPNRGDQQRLARAVYDALFGLGRLQPLVDDERIENIEVNGCDRVTVQFADGTRSAGPAVADSDAELLDFLAFISSRSEGEARSFSPTRPSLHMTLDGGARLAATAWITPRPIVVIRRHRLLRVTLAELVSRSMMSPLVASFLSAAIKDRRSVVVAGPQGAGKTTLVRALAEELPAWERIGTFETEYELFLHELPGRFASVAAWQARPGTGERGLDGRQAGEITLDDCLYDSFRFNLDRQIVGEVRGREVLAMFKAMQSGAGSISTTHAASAVGAIRKLITCALEAGPQVTVDYAERVVAEHIDLIVQVGVETTIGPDGAPNRRRFVREVVAVSPGEDGPAHTMIFGPVRGPNGVEAQPMVIPDDLRSLVRLGFDLSGFVAQAAQHAGSPT